MQQTRRALIAIWSSKLGQTLALAGFIGTVPRVLFRIANARLANIFINPILSSWTIKSGLALVAINSLSVVLTI